MADPNSYGFRRNDLRQTPSSSARFLLSNWGGARWIFEGDIESCFDRISHEWLMAHIPMCKSILPEVAESRFMEEPPRSD